MSEAETLTHDWHDCEICYLMVIRYGESYFDPATGWHPRPVTVFRTDQGIRVLTFNQDEEGQDDLGNLHHLKDGEVTRCLSLS